MTHKLRLYRVAKVQMNSLVKVAQVMKFTQTKDLSGCRIIKMVVRFTILSLFYKSERL